MKKLLMLSSCLGMLFTGCAQAQLSGGNLASGSQLNLNGNVTFQNPTGGAGSSQIWQQGLAYGTCTNTINCSFNEFSQGSDAVDASAAANGGIVYHFSDAVGGTLNGTTAKGPRRTLRSDIVVNLPTADSTGQDYVAVASFSQAAVNVGGTAGAGNGQGGLFGLHSIVQPLSGATFWHVLNGAEFDNGLLPGTSGDSVIGISAVQSGATTVAAQIEDVGVFVARGVDTTPGWLVLFQDGNYDGWPGLKATGTIFKCWVHASLTSTSNSGCGTIANGFDLRNYDSITGSAFASPGFSVSGLGTIQTQGNMTVGSAQIYSWNSRAVMWSPADGVIELTNAAATGFTALDFGGTTSSFPSLKRSSATLSVRLADDSADAALSASAVTATVGSLQAAGNAIVGAGQIFSWNGRSDMWSPADGIIELTNNGATDFTRLQFGGTTSSFPALKRSSTALAVRLADDSADAPITAANVTSSGVFNAPLATPASAAAACTAGTIEWDTGFVYICTASGAWKRVAIATW